MKIIGIIFAFALLASMNVVQAAAEQSARLPAGDNVQNQTQAKVREAKPRAHHKRKKHRHSLEDKSVTQ